MLRDGSPTGAAVLPDAGARREPGGITPTRRMLRRLAASVQRSEAASAFYRAAVRVADAAAPYRRAEARLSALLDRAPAAAAEPVRGRVVLVGRDLVAGGAERQMLNTLTGLDSCVRDGRLESVRLLLERLPEDGSRSFYAPQLRAAGLGWQELPTAASVPADLEELRPALTRVLQADRATKILAYAGFFRETRPELVHLWQDWTNVLAGLGAALAGVPAILLSARNLSPVNFLYWHPLLRPAYRALLARRRAVLFNNSQAGAADYARWLRVSPERIGVLRNGVMLSGRDQRTEAAAAALRRSHGIPDGAPVICSAFRFWPEKRPGLWIRTAARIAAARPEIRFLVAGWGPLVGRARAQAARVGLGGRLAIVEAQQDIAAAICAGDLFLLTSRAEGIPNVVLEAQCLGVPVVATAAGGIAETMLPGETGAIVAARPAALAAEALAWLDDAARRRRVREAGPRWVAQGFGLDRMLAETIAAYDGLLGRVR